MRLAAPLVMLLLATGRPAAGQTKIIVGPNVRVSSANGDRAHWETRIGADPENANRLIACSYVHSSTLNVFHTVVYLSQDAGKTWRPTLETEGADYIGDPDCIFGLDGAAYFATLPLHYESDRPPETRVYRSLDGGAHWSQPVVLPFIDREYLTIDRTRGPHRGQLYLQGNVTRAATVDGDSRIVFNLFRSTDKGVTFKPPVELLPDGEHQPFGNGSAVVLSDGSYIAAFPEWADRRRLAEMSATPTSVGDIKVVRSEDGGESFDRANTVAPWYECRGTMTRGLPMLAADNTSGPFKDRLYVVWGDKQSGHCDIRVSYSSDKGKTWSTPRIINDEPDQSSPRRTANHSMPLVAVNNQGVVGVAWYDRRDNPDGLGWYVRFAASLDGGETWLPSTRVSSAPQVHRKDLALPVWAYSTGGGSFPTRRRSGRLTINVTLDQGEDIGGDTAGMEADAAGNFHPPWVDNRTGTLQLWTASISVPGRATKNGDVTLAGLTDVTRDVTLRFTNTRYDPAAGTIAFDAALLNTSATDLRAPLVVRVLGLRSGTGAVSIAASDNKEAGTGSTWDFSSLITGGVLKPGQQTRVRRLTFKLADFDPFRRTSVGYVDPFLVSVDCVVLGKK